MIKKQRSKTKEKEMKEKFTEAEKKETTEWIISEIKRMIKRTKSRYVFGHCPSMLYHSLRNSILKNKRLKSITKAIINFQTEALFIMEGAEMTDFHYSLITNEVAKEIVKYFINEIEGNKKSIVCQEI